LSRELRISWSCTPRRRRGVPRPSGRSPLPPSSPSVRPCGPALAGRRPARHRTRTFLEGVGVRVGGPTSRICDWQWGPAVGAMESLDCVVTGMSLSNTRIRDSSDGLPPLSMHNCRLSIVPCRWAAEREAGERDGCGIRAAAVDDEDAYDSPAVALVDRDGDVPVLRGCVPSQGLGR